MHTMVREMEAAAHIAGILQIVNASSLDALENAYSAISTAHASALILFSSPMFYINYRRLVELGAKYRLPTM